MSDIAIKVDNVSKTFKLPHEKTGSVKNAFVGLFNGKRTYEKQEVLKDISFDIKKGEFFGIVGRNGSGKSTLLKLIAGIYSPNNGAITVNGLLTPFIELGVGFNPELTGRENVFLNGALLGFNRSEMESMYDEIVQFAELEKFMDQKLKNYSSGMQVRLAFSIAIQAKSDVLVLDEVLAVGDSSFQRKCMDIFEQYKANKQTVILVTHDMSNVIKFCSRAMLIADGQVVDIGNPIKIAKLYDGINQESIDKETASKNEKKQPLSEIKTDILNHLGKNKTSFDIADKLTLKFSWSKKVKVDNLGVALMKETGELVYGVNTFEESDYRIHSDIYYFDVDLNIGPGRYYFMFGAFGKTEHDVVSFVEKGPSFIVKGSSAQSWQGVTELKSRWYE